MTCANRHVHGVHGVHHFPSSHCHLLLLTLLSVSEYRNQTLRFESIQYIIKDVHTFTPLAHIVNMYVTAVCDNIICDIMYQQRQQTVTDIPKNDVSVKMTQTGQVRSKERVTTAQIQSFENTIDCVGSRQYQCAEDNALYADFRLDDVDVDNHSVQSIFSSTPRDQQPKKNDSRILFLISTG